MPNLQWTAPTLDISFYGDVDLDPSLSWVDANGVTLSAQEFHKNTLSGSVFLRVSNPNAVAGSIDSISWGFPSPIVTASLATLTYPISVPVESAITIEVALTFSAAKAAGDVAYLDASGNLDTGA